MITRGRTGAVLGICCMVLAVGFTYWPKAAPAIVLELRAMPEAARVEWSGPADAGLTVVQLCDWHYVPKELCEMDGIGFDDVCDVAAAVQQSEMAIARRLIKTHGIKAIYSEGLSEQTVPALQLRLDLLKSLRDIPEAEQPENMMHITLEVGTPGRLWIAGEIEEVYPLEVEKALQDAKPVADGEIIFDEARVQARRKAMASRLPTVGFALIVLGGSHDLGPHLAPGTLYVQVTPRGYSK